MVDRNSMQISVPGYSETKPTFFTIQVCYEQATFSIQRRYSDFVELVARLEEEMGELAPGDLPGKKWLGSSSRAFLEERRRGLEVFLRAIVKRDEWRESLAFLSFIELSKHVKSAASQTSKALGEWIKGVSEAQDLIRSAGAAKNHSEAHKCIVLASNTLKDLDGMLTEEDAASSLGSGEYRKRRDLLNELNRSLKKAKQELVNPSESLNNAYNGTSGAGADDLTSQLFGSHRAKNGPRVLGAAVETARTRDLNNTGLMQLQQTDMQAQDQVIDNLRRTVQRQKQLGLEINDELQHQIKLLDDLDQDTHATNARLNQARRRTGKLL